MTSPLIRADQSALLVIDLQERMRAHGIAIVCREMVAFEWLAQAGTDQFRDISKNFLK
jgi:hypothetical protein